MKTKFEPISQLIRRSNKHYKYNDIEILITNSGDGFYLEKGKIGHAKIENNNIWMCERDSIPVNSLTDSSHLAFNSLECKDMCKCNLR